VPRQALTDLTLRTLPAPAAGQVTYWDTLPGFGLRVSQGGTKTFVLVLGKRRQRKTIGRYPILSLSEARTEAKRLLARRTLRQVDPTAIPFADALDLFFEKHCDEHNKERTAYETKRLLNRHFRPKLKDEQVSGILSDALTDIIDDIAARAVAHNAYVAARTFFNWAKGRRYVTVNPLDGVEAPPKSQARERVLTDEEIVTIYRAAEQYPDPFGKILRLLLLTGQRRQEVAELRAEWIDRRERTVTLPSTVTKNKRQHTFPYGPEAAGLLLTNEASGPFFPSRTNEETVFSGWSKAKRVLDQGIAADRKRQGLRPFPAWRIHDIRRTFASKLAKLSTPVHVTEKFINHISGTQAGIVSVYQRYQYLPEMRQAVAAYEAHLDGLLRAREDLALAA
jgi:integrase